MAPRLRRAVLDAYVVLNLGKSMHCHVKDLFITSKMLHAFCLCHVKISQALKPDKEAAKSLGKELSRSLKTSLEKKREREREMFIELLLYLSF